jgi:uncharacterized PurR-regulated membrane protein YhhQ (DUF165 family)
VTAKRLAAVAALIATVVGANAATSRYGLVPVGFGLVATAGTFAAGLSLIARDVVQDAAGRLAAAAAVLVAAALSALVAAPALAVASGVAFAVSELADGMIYTPLRKRGWAVAVLSSSAVGAIVDTLLFVSIAFGAAAVTAPTVAGQLLVKVVYGAAAVVLARAVVQRAVLR